MQHRTTISVVAAPRVGQPTRHVASVFCSCGWEDEHPTGSRESSLAHAQRNVAAHKAEARSTRGRVHAVERHLAFLGASK